MALIDEFLYGLGFNADLRGGQAFDEQLKRIGDHGESTRHSLLSTITAANLLSHALEKGAEMAKEAFLSLKNNGVEPTAAEMKAMGDTMAAATCWIKT